MKRCPTFRGCRILDFNVFSYELANFKMAQLCSNMKRCYPILVTGILILNTFDCKFIKSSVDLFQQQHQMVFSLFCFQDSCFPNFPFEVFSFVAIYFQLRNARESYHHCKMLHSIILQT